MALEYPQRLRPCNPRSGDAQSQPWVYSVVADRLAAGIISGAGNPASYREATPMSTLIHGGTGFIGRRLVPLLAQRGEEVVCMDLNPGTASYGQLGDRVRVVRGDVTQFDDVMAVTVAAKPSRVVNLAYFLGSEHAPHVATKLNIVGMDT